MADRFPLIANSSSNQIQELASGDTLDLTGNMIDNCVNVKATGITTLSNTTDSTSTGTGALIISGGVGIAKNVYIGAGLSVAGTLTYEDVTNVDSVGLITAKSGVNVTGGQIQVGAAFSVGPAGVVTATSFVGSGALLTGITQTTINSNADNRLITGSGTANTLNGESTLTYNGSTLALTGNETISSQLNVGSNIKLGSAGVCTATTFVGALTGNVTGTTSNATNVTVADESSDTTCFPLFATAATGDLPPKSGSNLTFNSSSGALTAASFVGSISGGSVSATTGTFTGDVFFDNGQDAGKDLTFDVSADALIFNDSVYASFGSDQDMSIWHDGSNAYMQNTTGSLYIRPKSGEDGITIVPDAGVSLSHNNLARLETTNDGVKITGIGTFTAGANFDGILSEKFHTTAGKLSNNTNIDLANGMVHYFSTAETTTSTPNIRYNSSKSLNNMLTTGDSITVTIITTAAAAGYSAQLNIDGSGQTEEWIGGSAPAAGGSSGFDIYTYNILKTGSTAYKVIANYLNATN